MTVTRLRTVLGDYPHVKPLKAGQVASDLVAFDFVDFTPTNKAFKPMVRELAFDVCEMAIVTYLMAKAHGKPLVLLPALLVQLGWLFLVARRVGRAGLSWRAA